MAEFRFGALYDVVFNGFPDPVLVTDFFTETANRQYAFQRLNLFFQLPFLNCDLIYQIGETDEHDDKYAGIDHGMDKPERRNPEPPEEKVNQRHDHGKHQAPPQTLKPGNKHNWQQVQNGKSNQRS